MAPAAGQRDLERRHRDARTRLGQAATVDAALSDVSHVVVVHDKVDHGVNHVVDKLLMMVNTGILVLTLRTMVNHV